MPRKIRSRRRTASASPRKRRGIDPMVIKSLSFALHGADPLQPWFRTPAGGHIPLEAFPHQLPPRKANGPRVGVVSGIVGVNKGAICEAAAENARRLYKIDVEVAHIGRRICQITDAPPNRVLFLSPKRLADARRQAFFEVADLVNAGKNVIVNTHGIFHWHDGTFPGFDESNREVLGMVGADTFISVLDNIPTAHARLRDGHRYHLTLAQVAKWRTADEAVMRELAGGLAGDRSHFIMGRGTDKVMVDQTALAIAKRIFGPQDLTVVYACFPMTFAFHIPQMMAAIRKFCDALAHKVISQNPASVDEWAWFKAAEEALRKNQPTFRWQTEPGVFHEFSTIEVIMLGSEVEGEILGRDYLKVAQAHMIAAYVPARPDDDGRPSISAGMQKELAYGHSQGLVNAIVWGAAKHKPSPFDKQHSDFMFRTLPQLLEAIPERVRVVPEL